MTTKSAHISWGWICGALVLVCLATLTPQPGSFAMSRDFFAPALLIPSGDWRDVFQNILLYLPLGLLLALRGGTLTRSVLGAGALSLLIELSQAWVPGRNSVAVDVVTNTVGALVGWVIAATPAGAYARTLLVYVESRVAIVLCPGRGVAAALSLIWALLIAATTACVCWLLSPALPPPFFFGVASPTIDTAAGPLRIGGDGVRSNGFRGLIDEVRIYTRALSEGEIESDMQHAVSSTRSPDLVAAYGFDSRESARWSAEGRFGGAAVFDGEHNAIVDPGVQNFERGLTIEAWVFPTAPLDGNVTILADRGSKYYVRGSSFGGPPLPSAGARFAGVPRFLTLRRQLPIGEWSHIAATYDGQDFRLFLNGRASGGASFWSAHRPVRMSLDDNELPPGPIPRPTEMPALLSSDFRLGLTIQCGAKSPEPAPVFLMMGLQSVDVLAVDAAGSELRVRSVTRARELGLASPPYRAPDALTNCSPGTPLSLTLKGPLQRVSLEGPSIQAASVVGPGIGSGWAFFLDSQRMPTSLVALVSNLYLAVLVLPFGYWARVHPLTIVGTAILGASLIFLPRAWAIPPLDPSQVLWLIVAASAGMLAWRRRVALQNRAPVGSSTG